MKLSKRARKKAEKELSMAEYVKSAYESSSIYDGENLLQELSLRDNKYTKDFVSLKMQDYHPVFVYGTLKAGNRLHNVIQHCPYLGRAVTYNPLYDLKNAPNSDFPVAFKVKSKPSHASWKIQGEIYAVDAKTMLLLDDIESNGYMYQRQEVMMRLLDQTYDTTNGPRVPYIKAWMYIGDERYWENYQMTRPTYSREMNSKGEWDMIFDWKPRGNFNHMH